MVPDWIRKLVDGHVCSECGTIINGMHITAFGIRKPAPFSGSAFQVEIFLVAACPYCTHQRCFTAPPDLKILRQSITPVFNWLQRPRPNEVLKSESAGTSDDDSKTPPRVRPSFTRRRPKPTTPISQDEVDTFLRRLKRTSFKVKSTTFDHWLRRLYYGPKYRKFK